MCWVAGQPSTRQYALPQSLPEVCQSPAPLPIVCFPWQVLLLYGFESIKGSTSLRVALHHGLKILASSTSSRVQLLHGFNYLTDSTSLGVQLHHGFKFITGCTSSRVQLQYGFNFIMSSYPLRAWAQIRYGHGFAFMRDSRWMISIIWPDQFNQLCSVFPEAWASSVKTTIIFTTKIDLIISISFVKFLRKPEQVASAQSSTQKTDLIRFINFPWYFESLKK